MTQGQINLFHHDPELVFQSIREKAAGYEYDFKKHVVLLKDELNETMGFIRLPLHWTLKDDLSIVDRDAKALYLTIESGNAAVCMMEGKENVYHTTFSAYMTRKKQGFSQIKYLKKKGKSKAGSRVRLAKTVTFFENINETLTELLDTYDVNRIALSCSATLIPFLFQSKVACPFEKKDPRLYKIPLHIPQSNFTNLDAAIKKLQAPILFFDTKYENSLRSFFEL
ncbi:MAG: hypothetical protein RIA62_18840 [Cyclobacteriaceae bacterium]